MSVLFRSIQGILEETVAHGGATESRSTGASLANDEVIKLKCIHYEVDNEKLYPSSTANAFLEVILTCIDVRGGGAGFPFKWSFITGGAIETSKDIFVPDNFPEIATETFELEFNTNNIEATQKMGYMVIYEIVKSTPMAIAQAIENYSTLEV